MLPILATIANLFMASDHASGGIAGTRPGGLQVCQSFPMTFADVTGVAKKLCTIAGTIQEPMAFRIDSAVLMTAFNGSVSVVLSAGIVGAGYIDMINAQDVRTGVTLGTNLTLAANPVKIVTVNTDVYALITEGGTDSSAGLAYINVEIWPVNVTEPTSIAG